MATQDTNGKIKMPGYGAKVKTEKAQDLANAARKLQQDKKKAIGENLPPEREIRNLKARIDAVASGIKIAGLAQLVFFAIGSGAHYFDTHDERYETEVDGVTNVHIPRNWYNGASYGQAVKNAYLFDDFIHGKEGGTWQAIAGLIAILTSLELARRKMKEKFDDIESWDTVKRRRWEHIDVLYSRLEALKEHGVNVEHMIVSFKDYASKMVSKMAEMDRGYLENLLNGGLENANWEVANAIVAGHLKSHPEDYNEIIKIIDQATLDPALVKKYGKDNVMSFGAASAMMQSGGRE